MRLAKIWTKYKQRASKSKREKKKGFREIMIIPLMNQTKKETKKFRRMKN